MPTPQSQHAVALHVVCKRTRWCSICWSHHLESAAPKPTLYGADPPQDFMGLHVDTLMDHLLELRDHGLLETAYLLHLCGLPAGGAARAFGRAPCTCMWAHAHAHKSPISFTHAHMKACTHTRKHSCSRTDACGGARKDRCVHACTHTRALGVQLHAMWLRSSCTYACRELPFECARVQGQASNHAG